jgi:hypothetical protein
MVAALELAAVLIVVAGCGGATAPAPPGRAAASVPGRRAVMPPGRAASAASTSATSAAVATAQRTHEYPYPAGRQTVIGGWRNPVQAVQVFATTYINWTAATVSDRLRALAEVSVGQARSAMALAAADTAGDYELQRGGIANAGVVEAIAPLAGGADRYAVVTEERTTATGTAAYRGLAPGWHLALATVTRVGGLWVVSAWEPES